MNKSKIKRLNLYNPRTINAYFRNRVRRWMVKEIKKAIEAEINIGAATLIFTYFDVLGGLILPKGNNYQRFSAFIERYLNPINVDYSFWCYKLYRDARCGLVHDGKLLNGTAIYRSDKKEVAKYDHLEKYGHFLTIDLITLFKDYENATKKLNSDINKDHKLKYSALTRLKDIGYDKITR